MNDSAVLQFHLSSAGVGHWTEALLRNDFTLKNLHQLCESDLRKLRITNIKDQKQLLAVAKQLQEQTSGVPRVEESGLLRPTASDCCRGAANFLAFHHVDRSWPKSGSSLSANIGLSTASPRPSSAFKVLLPTFSSAVATVPNSPRKEKWRIVNQRNCQPPKLELGRVGSTVLDTVTIRTPCDHAHGKQSSRCDCCDQHVRENAAAFSGGQWQFQSQEIVYVGDHAVDHVYMWKPFAAVESLMIENAWRRKFGTVKIGGGTADLGKMRWKEMNIRRNGDFSVSFPSLGRREVVTPPELPHGEISSLEEEFAKSFFELAAAAEDQARSRIELEEESALQLVRAELAADVQQTFATHQLQFKDEESKARESIEVELDIALAVMWDAFHEGCQSAVLTSITRAKAEEAAAVCLRQIDILNNLERIGRCSIEDEEQAAMTNLCKLVARFNAQVRAMLAGATKNMTVDPSIRCPICNKSDCQFFTTKWKGQWSHRGSSQRAAGEHYQEANRGSTLSALLAEVEEKEYRDFIKQYPTQHKLRVRPPSPRLLQPCRPSSSTPRTQNPRYPPMRYGSSPSPRKERDE